MQLEKHAHISTPKGEYKLLKLNQVKYVVPFKNNLVHSFLNSGSYFHLFVIWVQLKRVFFNELE